MIKTIVQREPRNYNARVIDEMVAGQTFLITRNGVPGAELRPVQPPRRTFVPKGELQAVVAAERHVEAAKFRFDLDRVVDQSR